MSEEKRKKCIILFTVIVSIVSLAEGLSGGIFSNYFKDVFAVTAQQRGFLETPRESGGILCVVLFALLGFLGDASLGILAQLLMSIGLMVMAFLQPRYGVMILFLFTYSMGQHLFMPVNDSISLSLAQNGENGGSLGHFKRYSSLFSMIAGAIVFVTFRFGWFSFNVPVIIPFVMALCLNLAAAVLLVVLKREMPKKQVKNSRFVVRKAYIPYYLTTFAFGCQKRIRIVFGPWIIIELLAKGADTIALLVIATKFLSSFVAPRFGRFVDRKGIRMSLRVEAAYMAVVFLLQGILAGGLYSGDFVGSVWFWVACVGYMLTGLTDQFQTVHSVLLKELAGGHSEDIAVSLSMGVSVDHVMAIVVSPILGLVWTQLGPAWVFYIAAASVLMQVVIAQKLKKPDAIS